MNSQFYIISSSFSTVYKLKPTVYILNPALHTFFLKLKILLYTFVS